MVKAYYDHGVPLDFANADDGESENKDIAEAEANLVDYQNEIEINDPTLPKHFR